MKSDIEYSKKVSTNAQSSDATDANASRADELEKVAFNFCKAATLMFLTWPLGRFALPFVAGVAGFLFLASHFSGQKTTRCVLQKPLYVGAFWAIVAGASLLWVLKTR